MELKASGRVRLPVTWRAVRIEESESGTVIYAERRGVIGTIAEAVERLVDRWEEPFRRNVWPWLSRRKR